MQQDEFRESSHGKLKRNDSFDFERGTLRWFFKKKKVVNSEKPCEKEMHRNNNITSTSATGTDGRINGNFIEHRDGNPSRIHSNEYGVEFGNGQSRIASVCGNISTQGGQDDSTGTFGTDYFDTLSMGSCGNSIASSQVDGHESPERLDSFDDGEYRSDDEGSDGFEEEFNDIVTELARTMFGKFVGGLFKYITNIVVPGGHDGINGCLQELDFYIDKYPPSHWYIIAVHDDHVHVHHMCPNLGALLEESTSNHQTTTTYCDTYLKAIDSSTELVASQKLEDYLIDINMYRYVLKLYLIKKRDFFLNYSVNIVNNHIFHYNKRKDNTNSLSTFKSNDKYKLLKLHNSDLVQSVMYQLHIKYDKAMLIAKLIVTTDRYSILNIDNNYCFFDDIIIEHFNEKQKTRNKRCAKCTFYHGRRINTNSVAAMKKNYPLLTYNQCNIIIRSCLL